MGKSKTIHVTLAPNALVDLDEYRYVARKGSRSDAIKQLVHIALHKTMPDAHKEYLERMTALQRDRSPEEQARIQKKNWDNRERIHITFNEIDEGRVARYRDLAGYYEQLAPKTVTRAETIRYLCGLAFEGKYPDEHIEVVEKLEAEIKRRAEDIWDAEGRIFGKEEEHWNRAEIALATEAAEKWRMDHGVPDAGRARSENPRMRRSRVPARAPS